MLYALLALVIAATVAVVLINRVPLRANPRYKFNSAIPWLLRTGAVTVLGWCFVRGSFIRSQHRAHEMYHHNKVVYKGRWVHLGSYIWTFIVLFVRTRGARMRAANGRVYFVAYYDHPEEIQARQYEVVHSLTWPSLGQVS